MTYYDDIAEGYEELHRDEQMRKYKLIRALSDIDENTTVLDVGCGTGFGSEHFIKYEGIDPSAKLVQIGKDRGLKLQVGKGEELPYPNNSFDFVMCVTAIHNFDDFKKGILEMKRVSKKDVVVSVLMAANDVHDIELGLREEFFVLDTVHDSHDVFFLCRVQ
jgi:ubiquinone/menaquinone biosynthesis C-methylase UbiE